MNKRTFLPLLAPTIAGLTLLSMIVLGTLTAAHAQHPLRGSVKLSMILCKFSDSPAPSSANSFQDTLFGHGTGSLYDYWNEISNGNIYLEGTINGWYTVPLTIAQASELNYKDPDRGRDHLFSACYEAARKAGYTTPSDWARTVIITSPGIDAWGRPGIAFLPDNAGLGQMAHEIGHALYLEHSFSSDPYYRNAQWSEIGEYDDQWDIMSWGNTFGEPGYNGVHLERMGWLPREQILAVGADGGTGGPVHLKPLYSSANGIKLVRIPCDSSDRFHYLTIEFRTKTGRDSNIPTNIVLIHETRKHSDGYYYSYLLRKTTSIEKTVCRRVCYPRFSPTCGNVCTTQRTASDGTGAPDQSVTLNGVSIEVNYIDSRANEALVTVNLPSSLAQIARSAYGPNACKSGYVWREADSRDYVCVTPEVHAQTLIDNILASTRRNPLGGAYGPDTCWSGYVWREAFPNDHVCVVPTSRSQAAEDNQHAFVRLEQY